MPHVRFTYTLSDYLPVMRCAGFKPASCVFQITYAQPLLAEDFRSRLIPRIRVLVDVILTVSDSGSG
jgi:hypothetical protein